MEVIQLISLQHELGMSIGLDLDLQEMLMAFTKVSIRQLGLSSVHYYIFQADNDNGLFPEPNKYSTLKHLLSVPKSNTESRGHEFTDAIESITNNELNRYSTYHQASDEYVYYLALDNIGVLELHRFSRPIDDMIFNLLKPILKRLTISCQASIEHEQLLYAIEARKEAEEAIRYLAFHDELTDLPNRRSFMESLAKDIARSKRHGFFGAVLFLDLNRFKAINDTLGHATGDLLLIAVAKILQGIIRKEDSIARLSGDEFVIQFSKIASDDTQSRSAIQAVLEKIHRAFSKPIKTGKHALHVTPSIGVEIYPNGDASADEILHHADTAMYQAKSRGMNVSSFYDQQLSASLKLRLELEKELQLAVKHLEQFELFYQPQYNAAGTCIGAEALIRWNNPERGIVSPADFIPIAEETGLMLEIGQWVIRQACDNLVTLHQQGLPKSFKTLSINVSAIQLSQEDFVANLLAIMTEKSVPPKTLSIELTESTFIKSVDEVVDVISTLREQGITTSIDDFGTGYSSLSYLSRLPIETLKIDQAFVRGIHSDKGNHAIVEAIMALGKSLHVNIIAEGVETSEELACLNALECKQYQGYYFSRPIPYKELVSLICHSSCSV
ncbi:MAG: putative bifunctional diguanylate cyclase/phosphodiesterase [Cognaticolwellia sp.]